MTALHRAGAVISCAVLLGLSGCQEPSAERTQAGISYAVEATGGAGADNITYGKTEGEGGMWIQDDLFYGFGQAPLPWSSGVFYYPTGCWIQLMASTTPGNDVKLTIKDDGVTVATLEAERVGKLTYHIPPVP